MHTKYQTEINYVHIINIFFAFSWIIISTEQHCILFKVQFRNTSNFFFKFCSWKKSRIKCQFGAQIDGLQKILLLTNLRKRSFEQPFVRQITFVLGRSVKAKTCHLIGINCLPALNIIFSFYRDQICFGVWITQNLPKFYEQRKRNTFFYIREGAQKKLLF